MVRADAQNDTRRCEWLAGLRVVEPPTWCNRVSAARCEKTALRLGSGRYSPCVLESGRCISGWPGGIGCTSSRSSFSCDACTDRTLKLEREARRAVEHRHCTWRGMRIDVQLLHEPRGSRDAVFFGAGEQTHSWLKAAAKAELHCVSDTSARNQSTVRPDLTLVLADYRFFHTHPEASSIGAHGIGAHLVPDVRRMLCVHYRLMASTMMSTGGVALINFGGEWVEPDYIPEVERMLHSCGVAASRAILLHYNVGAMLPLEENFLLPAEAPYLKERWSELTRWAQASGVGQTLPRPEIRQAYWNSYYAAISRPTRACVETRELRARHSASLKRPATKAFTMLGGQAKTFRGVVMLEMARRGLLTQGRWSAGAFGFCSRSNASGALHPKAFATAGPLAYQESLVLLGNASLVRWLCSQLPRILDVDPSIKTAHTDFGAAPELYGETRFAVVLETSIDSASHDRIIYVTEKPLKPMLNLRPFVMAGSAGSLATLRSLGFRSFQPTIDESYDTILDREPRIRFALREVERLAAPSLATTAWPSHLASAVVHNQRHLACGGLRKALASHALAAVDLASRLARK